MGVQYIADWLRIDTSLHLIAVRVSNITLYWAIYRQACIEFNDLTEIPSNGKEAQYFKFINTWCAIPLQYMMSVYAEYLLYCGSVASKSTLTMSIDVYSHTQHTALRSFITWQLDSAPSRGHDQAIIQEHECTHKLSTIRYEISLFTLKIHLKVYVQCIKV